jgi:hypothetical protein
MAQADRSGPDRGTAFDLNSAVMEAIDACGGDLMATIRALVVANKFLLAQNEGLTAELDTAWKWISPGYTRSTNRRRMNTGGPE